MFGSYVEEHLARAVAAEPGRVSLRHRRARATDIALSDRGVRIAADDGGWLAADAAVIATGIFRKTAAVALSEGLSDDPRYVPDPYASGAFKRAAEARDAVILGPCSTPSCRWIGPGFAVRSAWSRGAGNSLSSGVIPSHGRTS
ncbi:MAG TPA: FAD/NAD(P)-binding protein [Thermoleophilaceae bacterium]|nr:FAD/NAD(P)-binding protein [Thermoleophilaceae bacterium]